MTRLDIRARMLLAAVLPVLMVSVLLAMIFLAARFDDMQDAYQQRVRSVTRQLALASEYGLFSGNQTQLQAVVRGALREPDVRWVAVVDSRGQLLASAGDQAGQQASTPALTFGPKEDQVFDAQRNLDTLAQPVFASSIALDDVFEEASSRTAGLPTQLGQVLVKFSRNSLDVRKQNMLLLGGMVSLLGLLFGLVLAVALARGVIRPIQRVSALVERIGRGDFSASAQDITRPGDPLRGLQNKLRKMAERLSHARDDLEQQISAATHALRAKKEEAEQATKDKSHFLAAASHDLRQPTHALGMFVTRLAQLPHDEQTHQLIGNLGAAVRAMQNLLDGLLDISRLEAQAVQVQLAPTELAGLLAQLRYDLAQTAQDKGLRLHIRHSAAWAMTDATLLYRILLNLVGNALRYTDRGGVVVACRLVNAGAQVHLQVWDSGIGIAPEHQQDVFKEFYQVDNQARDRRLGLGLGLNIVQRTAHLLGHPLALASRPGVGTRFSLTLPTAQPMPRAPEAWGVEHLHGDELQGAWVLVIEDDVLARLALVGLLGGWGMQVHEAQGLADALQALRAGVKPAVILSDYRLQDGQNGIAVVQQLRAHLHSAVPACLMSGDTDAQLMAAARAAGLTLLHKPVRPAKLRNFLRRVLTGQLVRGDSDLR